MQLKHVMCIQFGGQYPTQLIAPIVEITRDNKWYIRRNFIVHIIDQCLYLCLAAFCEQPEMQAQTMHRFLLCQFDFTMQEPAAFKTMCGNIRIQGLQNREAAKDGIAVMSRLIHRIFTIDGMWPNFFGNEIVLSTTRIISI